MAKRLGVAKSTVHRLAVTLVADGIKGVKSQVLDPGSRLDQQGRAKGADIIIDVALVSRVHCRLTVTDGGALEVLDLQSTNGTYVNGHRIDGVASLGFGDEIQVGQVRMRLERPRP